jgi:hypothetical protein
MPAIYARKNRTGVARGIFYESASRVYNEKTTVIGSSPGVSAGILKLMKIRSGDLLFSQSSTA